MFSRTLPVFTYEEYIHQSMFKTYHIKFEMLDQIPHTYKCRHRLPLLAYAVTTAGPHFKSECSQWSEP